MNIEPQTVLTPGLLDHIVAISNGRGRFETIEGEIAFRRWACARDGVDRYASDSEEAWLLRGALGYHEGVEHGMGGEGWIRDEAAAWCRGWEAAAKHDGNRLVVSGDTKGEDFADCESCSALIGEWHAAHCAVILPPPDEPAPGPISVSTYFDLCRLITDEAHARADAGDLAEAKALVEASSRVQEAANEQTTTELLRIVESGQHSCTLAMAIDSFALGSRAHTPEKDNDL